MKELTFVATKGLSAEVLTRIVKSRNEVESRPKGNDLDQPYPPKLEKLVLRGCPMSLAAEDIKYLKLNVERFEWSESVEVRAIWFHYSTRAFFWIADNYLDSA